MRGVSERIERNYRSLGVRTTFKSKETLREALVQTTMLEPEWKKNRGMHTRYYVPKVTVITLEKPE